MIDTGMQSSVTFGNHVFLYYNMLYSDSEDVGNLLHECCHVAQYSRLTIPKFLANYIAQANLAILSGHIDPHEFMPEETEAINFAANNLDMAMEAIKKDPSLTSGSGSATKPNNGSSNNHHGGGYHKPGTPITQ
jgi:hypothetical protein